MTDKNITILDDFLNEKELKIIQDNLNKIDYGPNETNKWLFDKIKNKFFPDKNLKPTDCSFRLRHNAHKVLPHKDDHVNYLFLCYLKGKEITYNGTGFYNDNGALDRYIGFKENRALFFDSHIFHTDLQALGESSPRYSLNIFYEEE